MARIKSTKDSSGELERLLKKVNARLEFHRQRCMSFAAVRGAIETELLRREAADFQPLSK